MTKKPAGSTAVRKIPSRGIKEKTGTGRKDYDQGSSHEPPPENAPPPPVVVVPPAGDFKDSNNPFGGSNNRGSNTSIGGEDDGPNTLRPTSGLHPPGSHKHKGSKRKGSKKKEGKHAKGRFIINNLWENCCNEIDAERREVDNIFKRMGLPVAQYRRRKSYGLFDYDDAPEMNSCMSKDYLDFYVFPTVLPALQALVRFARVNRIFQSKYATFDPMDFIVEYLYNNNPRYPERVQNPTPIFDIPFCKNWLEKNPRDPPPKWLIMSSDAAAVAIQKYVRGFLVRIRSDVAEMRQFWADFKQDLKEEKEIDSKIKQKLDKEEEEVPKQSDIIQPVDDFADTPLDPIFSHEVTHHSDTCVVCDAFRNFLANQPEDILTSYKRAPSIAKAPIPQEKTHIPNPRKPKSRGSDGGTSQLGEAMVGWDSAPHTARRSTPGETSGAESTKKGSTYGSRPSTSRLKKSEKHGVKSDRPNSAHQPKK